MRYIGSKSTLAPNICALASAHGHFTTFCDPFGGIATVGSAFKRQGYHVYSADHLCFPHYFQIARLELDAVPEFAKLRRYIGVRDVQELNQYINDATADGWLVREFATTRQFFTLENARRIEGARSLIKDWNARNLLNRSERAVLLASLIDSADKVANTAGTYAAYLKSWTRKAHRPFSFEFLTPVPGPPGISVRTDARILAGSGQFDILYLDPPYNGRQYRRCYHLPETLAALQEPNLAGKAGMPQLPAGAESDFGRHATAPQALNELLRSARFRLLIFHYSDSGLITPEQCQRLLANYGSVESYSMQTLGYKCTKGSRSAEHRVYLVHHA